MTLEPTFELLLLLRLFALHGGLALVEGVVAEGGTAGVASIMGVDRLHWYIVFVIFHVLQDVFRDGFLSTQRSAFLVTYLRSFSSNIVLFADIRVIWERDVLATRVSAFILFDWWIFLLFFDLVRLIGQIIDIRHNLYLILTWDPHWRDIIYEKTQNTHSLFKLMTIVEQLAKYLPWEFSL